MFFQFALVVQMMLIVGFDLLVVPTIVVQRSRALDRFAAQVAADQCLL